MSDSLTPMMRQYLSLRRDLPPGTLLLFRLGDFYELFFDDAKEASSILNLALTKRMDAPMCGVPYHSARSYIEKLIAAGKRVAICEQIGEVEPGKLTHRELTQILSPGSLDEFGLEDQKPNYLASLAQNKNVWGLAYADISIGEIRLAEFPDFSSLRDALLRIRPAEILFPSSLENSLSNLPTNCPTTPLENWHFDPTCAAASLCNLFAVHNLDGFGCSSLIAAISAAGGLLHYLGSVLRRNLSHFRKITPEFPSDFLLLDATTQEHLELTESRSGRSATLLATLDRTQTPMGARTLRHWILHPLLSLEKIHARQDAIASLLASPIHLSKLRNTLS
ncbi:MAG: DNA mismatch repair protein MutS, partial [Chthoniobacterales bacterium]|nr:DNA mismatch repair protein MutS [Chthoniobacterales bacterium]